MVMPHVIIETQDADWLIPTLGLSTMFCLTLY